MIRISFQGLKADKKVLRSEVKVNNFNEFEQLLRNNAIELIDYKIINKGNKIKQSKISMIEISNFSDKLSILLKSGLSLDKALTIVGLTIKKVGFKKIIDDIIKVINIGCTFSSALSKYNQVFPSMYISMIQIAEKVGNLPDTLNYLSKYYLKEHKLKQKISNALIYPKILFAIASIIFIMLVTFIIPKFEVIMESMNITDMPNSTKIIFNCSNFIRKNFLYILLAIGIICLIIEIVIRKRKSVFKDYLKVNFPIIKKINRTIITSQFTQSLLMLYTNGLSIVRSFIDSVQLINNEFLKKKMAVSIQKVLKGSTLSSALSQNKFFPKMMIDMIEVGEQSANLDYILSNISEYYAEEANIMLSKISQIIEPVIIMIMALIVCFVIISIFIPMFGVMNGIVEV